MDIGRQVQLLFELSSMRFVQRGLKQFLAPNVTNIAEHTYRVQWIALLLGKMEGLNEQELGKVAIMAMSHDCSEIRTGDVNYISRLYTKRNEPEAVQDTFGGTELHDLIEPLFHEAEAKESVCAKIVKDADNLDVDLEFKELEAMGWPVPEVLVATRVHVYEHKLFTKSAKLIWEQIQKSSPHDWHGKNKNRLNTGDWTDKK